MAEKFVIQFQQAPPVPVDSVEELIERVTEWARAAEPEQYIKITATNGEPSGGQPPQ